MGFEPATLDTGTLQTELSSPYVDSLPIWSMSLNCIQFWDEQRQISITGFKPSHLVY